MRDKGVLSLEEAVHKLTQVQADLFGFDDRGVIAEGKAADLVVFDPTRSPRARCAGCATSRPTPSGSPPTSPSGMRHLFVNGTPRDRRRRAAGRRGGGPSGQVLRAAH